MLFAPTGVIRPGWQELNRSRGLVFCDTQTADGVDLGSYWLEGPHVKLTATERDYLGRVGDDLSNMFYEAAEWLVQNPGVMVRMGIPEKWVPAVIASWQREKPNSPGIYGRLDMAYHGGSQPPKVLEYNADTATSLLEAAIIQWWWQIETNQGDDIWSELDDLLVKAWQLRMADIAAIKGRPVTTVYLCYTANEPTGEDKATVFYMADVVERAGYKFVVLPIEAIHLDPVGGGFYYEPPDGGRLEHIDVCFKLYPWEWMAADPFGDAALQDLLLGEFKPGTGRVRRGAGSTIWLEPVYKMLWSNKGILPVLWQLFKDHPIYGRYLLPAFFEDDPQAATLTSYVRKPKLSREGANTTIVINGEVVATTGGDYGEEGYVIQAYHPLPTLDGIVDGKQVGYSAVLGLWIVNCGGDGSNETAGVSFRFSEGPITNNSSYFVPHCITNSPEAPGSLVDLKKEVRA